MKKQQSPLQTLPFPSFLISAAAFSSSSVCICTRYRKHGRRTEFIDRECHIPEKAAGIFRRRHRTFFFRYTILDSVDQILCRAFYPYHREKTERHQKFVVFFVIYQFFLEIARHILRNLIQCTAAAAAAFQPGFHYLHIQNDGIHGFQNCHRQIVASGLSAAYAA